MFWGDNIYELIKFDIIPSQNMEYDEKLNALSRLIICISVVGFLFTMSIKYIIIGILTLSCIYFFKKATKNGLKEGFHSKKVTFSEMKEYYPITSSNPLGNVLISDYTEDPTRKPAPPSFNPVVVEDINEKTKGGDFKGLQGNIEFENLMHQFYSMPSTTIPNDQGAYGDYLYGNMPSCKEGDPVACVKDNYRYIQ